MIHVRLGGQAQHCRYRWQVGLYVGQESADHQ